MLTRLKDSSNDAPSVRLSDLLWECLNDPDLFNSAVLGRPDYWSRQLEICRAVSRYGIVVCPTGNSLGKSYLAAGLVLWWLYTRPGSLVIATAASQTLLGTVLFKELRRSLYAARQNGIRLPGTITESAKASPQTLIVDPAGHQVIGVATRGVERLSGQHHPELLAIVDEASGVDDEIWEAIDSQNPIKLVVFGNPLKAEGRFRDLSRRAAREKGDDAIPDEQRCIEIRIPSTESPDIGMARSDRGLADQWFINNAKRQYGENSLWYRSHVLAIFPDLDSDVLIPGGWIDRAETVIRAEPVDGGPVRMAIDLSEGVGRDRSCCLVRDNLGIREIWQDNTAGFPETAAKARTLMLKYGIQQFRISYDALGIGKGFDNDLAGVGINNAMPYHGSGKGGEEHTNLRTYAAFQMRNRLNPDWTLPLPPDRRTGIVPPGRVQQEPFTIPPGDWRINLREELTGLRYELTGKKSKLEDKKDFAKRLGRSPDIGDAMIQSFAFGDA